MRERRVCLLRSGSMRPSDRRVIQGSHREPCRPAKDTYRVVASGRGCRRDPLALRAFCWTEKGAKKKKKKLAIPKASTRLSQAWGPCSFQASHMGKAARFG